MHSSLPGRATGLHRVAARALAHPDFPPNTQILPFASITKMTVRAGGGGGDAVTDGYVPTIGRDGLKHRFCVETAKVCGTDRFPPPVKGEL